jgi:TolB protein
MTLRGRVACALGLSVVLLLVVVSAAGGSGRVSSVRAAGNGLIAFIRNGHRGIYVMRPDGSGIRMLVGGKAGVYYAEPAWSPDGQRIASVCSAAAVSGGQPDYLCVTTLASGATRRLAIGDGVVGPRSPSWSPDGRRIAFTATTVHGSVHGRDIYAINADGSGLRRLAATSVLWEKDVAWAPVGGLIASTPGGSNLQPLGLYVMNVNGSGQRFVVDGELVEGPGWSPDGRRIAFTHFDGHDGVYHDSVYVVGVGGGTPQRLAGNETDRAPAWSPDGRRIAFASQTWKNGRWGPSYVSVMNADGSGRTRLTPGAWPSWQPIP